MDSREPDGTAILFEVRTPKMINCGLYVEPTSADDLSISFEAESKTRVAAGHLAQFSAVYTDTLQAPNLSARILERPDDKHLVYLKPIGAELAEVGVVPEEEGKFPSWFDPSDILAHRRDNISACLMYCSYGQQYVATLEYPDSRQEKVGFTMDRVSN